MIKRGDANLSVLKRHRLHPQIAAAIITGICGIISTIILIGAPTIIDKTTPNPPTLTAYSCPDTPWANTQIGASLQNISVAWDPCQWKLASSSLVTVNCPSSWTCTIEDGNGKIWVYYGQAGLTLSVRGATFKYIPMYPSTHEIYDQCKFLEYERSYGLSQNPPYETYPGNFTCGD